MMTPTNLLNKILTATASDSSYTVPAGSKVIITALMFFNPAVGALPVSCQITPSGGSSLGQYVGLLLAGESVAVDDIYSVVLNAGDTIDFAGAGIVCNLSGLVIT